MRRRFVTVWRAIVGWFRGFASLTSDPLANTPLADEPRVPERTEEITDADLASPNERVVEIIQAAEGPLWQQDIVDRCDWSKSTVSRALGELEDAGVVVRTRVGREKVVFAAGEEPAMLSSEPIVDPTPNPPTPDVESPVEPEITPDDAAAKPSRSGERVLDR
ncbi:helix-turn-helix transcriptional regulator [Halorarius litoreus]|uniref:helix-turn-helix transcriptional regulator n=1 Tax=Halorarius litoreus TaxID=2962676 RepID=UPI0020CCA305|nr:winged helix-turn-helix domain-containing protein [Halorarius litoreus]